MKIKFVQQFAKPAEPANGKLLYKERIVSYT